MDDYRLRRRRERFETAAGCAILLATIAVLVWLFRSWGEILAPASFIVLNVLALVATLNNIGRDGPIVALRVDRGTTKSSSRIHGRRSGPEDTGSLAG